ncbi:uncharacterized protein LOC144629287 [Oculina patagonica]
MPGKKRGKRKTKSSTSSGDSPPAHATKKQNTGEDMTTNTAAAITSVTDLNEAMHEASVLAESEQPSLQELWKLLSRIEKNTTTLLAENASLKASLEFTQAQYTALETKNKKLEARVLTLEQQDAASSKKVAELEAKYDDIEQYSRKFNLEIHGIPEQEDEDILNTVLDLAEVLKVELQEEDIDICHRLYKGADKARPIIVKFSNYTSKYEMYSARLGLRNLDLAPKFGAEKIFINENLTKRRAALYSKVRKKIKNLPQGKSWTTDGKIFAKPTATGRRIRINSEDDLIKIHTAH